MNVLLLRSIYREFVDYGRCRCCRIGGSVDARWKRVETKMWNEVYAKGPEGRAVNKMQRRGERGMILPEYHCGYEGLSGRSGSGKR